MQYITLMPVCDRRVWANVNKACAVNDSEGLCGTHGEADINKACAVNRMQCAAGVMGKI